MDDTFNEDTEAGKRNRKKKTIKDIRRRMADAYKRNKREKKIDKLGPMYSEGFDWLEWESLHEDLAMYVSQLSIHKDIVKSLIAKYG